MTSAVVPYLVTGRALERTGNTGYSGQPTSALFVARDGRRISLGVVQQHQFVALAKLLGREDWLREPHFADPETRRANAPAVQAALAAVFRERDAAEWEALAERCGHSLRHGARNRRGGLVARAGSAAIAVAADGAGPADRASGSMSSARDSSANRASTRSGSAATAGPAPGGNTALARHLNRPRDVSSVASIVNSLR